VRILTATTSTWHTHSSPPFAYVIEGAVVIESKARPPIEVEAGHAIAEPTREVIPAPGSGAVFVELPPAGFELGGGFGSCRRGTVPTKLVIFYVAPPGTPFLEEVQR
jgi:hypothetical protein